MKPIEARPGEGVLAYCARVAELARAQNAVIEGEWNGTSFKVPPGMTGDDVAKRWNTVRFMQQTDAFFEKVTEIRSAIEGKTVSGVDGIKSDSEAIAIHFEDGTVLRVIVGILTLAATVEP